MVSYGMIGPAAVLGLGCIGSAVGCGIGGMAAHGVMSRMEENHGKFIGMSVLPSSQAIYAFVLMLVMKGAIDGGKLTAMNAIGIGISVGFSIMLSAIYQGMCAATGIQATAKQPSVYGKCMATLGIVESFSLFAFVFSFLLFQ
ncbi:MAG: ATP synthase subunit C [Simkaniaceae bacterium]|nr:ATP synthase subunit C [Simkaniaceae bacterium]